MIVIARGAKRAVAIQLDCFVAALRAATRNDNPKEDPPLVRERGSFWRTKTCGAKGRVTDPPYFGIRSS